MVKLLSFKLIYTGLLLLFAMGTATAAEPIELYWEDLVPAGFNELAPGKTDHNNKMAQVQPNAPVVEVYNNKRVKLPGFIVPLEGTAELTTEFLLVPFFGACIHVPPPASNQIVYVKMDEGVPVENLYDAVWVEGVFNTVRWEGDIAAAGYSMQGKTVTAY
ncbi:DUF3299 domain-containing protein [Aestuariibacter sp. GS-14]|uniref:DUF3299 domain-containing protein n=1 Tax=Aestuariibacter sp. GS-14 TaxID=2590670 RepID=UPI00112836FA|nr:DUF3299 domain-containing protein [Aestuariibacter sp. GS-14]